MTIISHLLATTLGVQALGLRGREAVLAYAFGVAGLITILGGLANANQFARVGGSSTPILFAGAGALAAAAIIPMLPWPKWNQRVTLVLPVLGLAMMCVSELGSKSSRSADGAMGSATVITLIFVWIGLTQPRWWSLASVPVTALALCLVFTAEDAPLSIATVDHDARPTRVDRRWRRTPPPPASARCLCRLPSYCP